MWPQPIRADSAHELGAPFSTNEPARVYGDGRGEELAWSDPELDLEPRGPLHLVLTVHGSWLGATHHFDEAGGTGLGLSLDVCLEPSISLHVRAGLSASLRTETRRVVSMAELRSAALVWRGTLLIGAHLGQLIALRTGIELGEGHSFIFGSASGATLGFAFVGQAAIRLAGGRLELGLEGAAELREGNLLHSSRNAESIQELAPRLSFFLALTP